MNNTDNSEIKKYYNTLCEDLRSIQLTEEEGGILEQIFTQYAIDLLTEAGETENTMVAHDEKSLGTRNQHKINAYSMSDNYETIDLFITIYKGDNLPAKISKDEINTSAKRITNFFKKGRYSDYQNDIEESSPIFDFVHTLGSSNDLHENLVRINVIILTNGIYTGTVPLSQIISGTPLFYRVVDLNYLYNITEKSHIPIEIDFNAEGFIIPCIIAPSTNEEYESYIAIIPGSALASIYEKYGSRLLEQNVRSFLQFTGKINKGIRNTILKEKHMFLAYNNGLAATADKIKLKVSSDKKGYVISQVENFQIVNGGQTTASIYHTMKKDKADISDIFVQMKLTTVKNKDNFSEIVSRISEYANTQNKVSIVDLSSNKPAHILLEKLSRNIWAPPKTGQSNQTMWFYERARGQYKNALLNFGFTKTKKKAFELKYPKSQVFKKEDLAKYVNSWQEIYEGKKLVIGPHFVVRGNQKNYVQFMNFNFTNNPDNIFFEDTIAKAIIFKSAEKIYGVKPNSIGDMRYITVPYSIAWLGFKLNYKLDLYKIWINQSISENIKEIMYFIMLKIEEYIKTNAPGSLYGEWAKKEECWECVKNNDFKIDLTKLKGELETSRSLAKRKVVPETDIKSAEKNEAFERIKSVHFSVWKKIYKWGSDTNKLSEHLCDVTFNIYNLLRSKKRLSEIEINNANKILDIAINSASELFHDLDEIIESEEKSLQNKPDITIEIIKKIVDWDVKNKVLKGFEFCFMRDLANGDKELNDKNKFIAGLNYSKVKKYGFDLD